MAQHAKIALPAGIWTLLTDGDVTAITLYNLQGECWIEVQNGVSTPTELPEDSDSGAIPINSRYDGYILAKDLADLAPGVATPNRVFGYSANGGAVLISHA